MENTKEKIIKMVKAIKNKKYLDYIYTLVKTLNEKEDQGNLVLFIYPHIWQALWLFFPETPILLQINWPAQR